MAKQEKQTVPPVRGAGAGRGFVNPKPVNVKEEDYVSPKDRMAMEEQMREEKTQRATDEAYERSRTTPYKKGGSVGSASKRADGCAVRGKTKGKMV
jgi:hypothetical protein